MEGLRGVGRELGREKLLRESCYLLSFSIFPSSWDLEGFRARKKAKERKTRETPKKIRRGKGEKKTGNKKWEKEKQRKNQ